jgi:hypothetical protein
MNIALIFIKPLSMDSRYEELTTTELRTIIIQEMRKFTRALELGATLSDLEEIRTYIRTLVDVLSIKEKEELKFVEKFPQLLSKDISS